jgi:hypothetical protein
MSHAGNSNAETDAMERHMYSEHIAKASVRTTARECLRTLIHLSLHNAVKRIVVVVAHDKEHG